MEHAQADSFLAEAKSFAKLLRTAKKNRRSVASHQTYAPRARGALASLRKSFNLLKRNYPPERFPAIAFQLTVIEPSVSRLVELFPSSVSEMIALVEDIVFKAESDLAAELVSPTATPSVTTAAPFLPHDLIADRYGVMVKVLWEANTCYERACYNACAAMLRRLVESLIVEAYEHHKISHKIQVSGEYIKFGAMIGKAAAEQALRLTNNTRKVLPSLKFFGDLGAHNRHALVRKADLDRLHSSLRAGIEELARNL